MTVLFNPGALVAHLEAQNTQVIAATLTATALAAHVYETAMKELIRGGHRKRDKTGATPGGPPENVTGNLRRSITVGEVRPVGLARFETEIGPTAVYGTYLEEGTRHMPAYPFIRPAEVAVEASGAARVIFQQAWDRALGI